MAERRVHVGLAVAETALAVAAAVLGQAATTDFGWISLAVGAVVVASLVPMPASGGSGLTPGAMVVSALPLIAAGGSPVFDLSASGAVVLAGVGGSALLALGRGVQPGHVLSTILRRLLGSSGYLGAFAVVDGAVPSEALDGWRSFVVFAVAGTAWMLLETAAAWLLTPGSDGHGRRTAALATMRDADVFTILVASGALFGLAFDALSWWALAVAALPFVFARGSFRRFRDASEAYTQTMRALAQIPEVSGHTPAGHAGRTADLAVLVGTHLGLRPSQLRQVEYAALMHDIGRLALNEPSVIRQGYTESDIAVWGAEIVGEVSYLETVADIVRRQQEPYRYPGAERSDELPVSSRIVKVASAYDDAVTEGLTPLEAVERLHQGSVYDYDPEIVTALRAVLTRRRALHLARL